MAKSKMANKSKKQKKSVVVRRTRAPMPLDAAAYRYAQLLTDPCNSALVPSTFPGFSGIVQRFTSYVNVGTTAATTAGVFVFNPNTGTIATFDGASGATPGTIGYTWSTNSPGYSFLGSNGKDARCLAACIQVLPLASELNRSGYISVGLIDSNVLPNTGTISASQLCQNLAHTQRVPDDMVEFKYIPGLGDELFAPVTSTSPSQNTIDMAFAWVGQPAAAGFLAKVTYVVEWTPQALDATLSMAHVSCPSSNTTNQVKKYLQDVDPEWWVSASKMAGKAARVLADTSLAFLSRRDGPRLLTY
jgi:hypothetical protein